MRSSGSIWQRLTGEIWKKKERIGIIISIQIFCIILILNKNVSRDALLLWPALTAVNAAYMLRDIRRQERDK
jgi:hypothetical protein